MGTLFATAIASSARASTSPKKLLALWERGLPHWLDAETLETRGRYGYTGMLRNRSGVVDRLLAPELLFSAHPKVDVDTGALVNFGTLMGVHNQLVSYGVGTGGDMRTPQLTPLESLSRRCPSRRGRASCFTSPMGMKTAR